jgi:Predicted acyltransferases
VDRISHAGEKENYRRDIDGLRAFSVLIVVIYHAFPEFLSGGFIGVDIFFVISGYIITRLILSHMSCGSFSVSQFYARRIRRIFPALAVVLIFSLVTGWFVLLSIEMRALGESVFATSLFYLNFLLYTQAGYFDQASELKVLMHIWSLCVEEQFYIIFPVILIVSYRFHRSALTIGILALISCVLSIIRVDDHLASTFFLPHTRYWELFAGGLLAHLHCQAAEKTSADRLLRRMAGKMPAWARGSMAPAGFLALIGAAFVFHGAAPYPGWRAIIPVAGALLIIAAGPNTWLNRRVLSFGPVVYIGLISYPLYLWHWPLLAFLRNMEGYKPDPLLVVSALALSLVLSAATYHFVELPLRFGGRQRIKVAALCALMLVLGAIGGWIGFGKNVPFRNAALNEILATFTTVPEYNNEYCRESYKNFSKSYCWLEKPDTPPSIMVVGDSHAYPLSRAVLNHDRGPASNMLFLGWGGCVPFYGVGSHQKGEPEGCSLMMPQALDVASSTDSIKTVILVSRGPLHITGKGFGDRPEEKGHNRVLEWKGDGSIQDYAQIFRSGLRETLRRLGDRGKTVVFVIDNPELGFTVQECVDMRPVRLGERKKLRQPCSVSWGDYESRSRVYRQIVTEETSRFSDVVLVDAAELLCDSEECSVMRNGEILYTDDDHLSVKGGRLIVDEIMRRLPPSGKQDR